MELREKLRLALAAAPMRRASTLPRPTLPRRQIAPDDLRLIRRETTLGGVYLTEERWPLDYRHGHFALGEALGLAPGAMARLAPALQASEL
ncbi:MAG TPA: hypothetical protein VLS25_08240, partial [Dehalococcoidia bacterium]|nr:hypothetical protein [Dehalococcoidia bacterium]